MRGPDEARPLTAAEKFAQRSGREIAEAARSAMNAVRSVRIEMDIQRGTLRDRMQVSMTRDGDCVGTLLRDVAVTKVVRSAGRGYFQPANAAAFTEFFGRDAEAASDFVDHRWILDEGGVTDQMCDLDGFVESAFAAEATPTGVTGPELYERVPVVRVEVVPGEVLVVHAEEPHYVLRAESEVGILEFAAFDREVKVTLPPPESVADLDDLPSWEGRPA